MRREENRPGQAHRRQSLGGRDTAASVTQRRIDATSVLEEGRGRDDDVGKKLLETDHPALSPRLGSPRTGILRLELVDERQRGAPQRLERCRGGGGQELHRGSIAERRVGTFGVVGMAPSIDLLLGVAQGAEPVQVQALGLSLEPDSEVHVT